MITQIIFGIGLAYGALALGAFMFVLIRDDWRRG